jgi:hypothetical protein
MLTEIKPSGNLLVLHRDLSQKMPGIGIGCGMDGGNNWQRIASLDFYEGSRFLAVYYLCDQDASPWIEGANFTLEHNFL